MMNAQACFLLLFLSVSAHAAENSYIQSKEEGWFWYNEDPVIEEPEKEPLPPPTPLAAPPTASKPAEPAPFSVVWLKNKMPEFLNHAIDNPTIENVSAYKYLLRISMDKSHQFAETYQLASYLDPALDENTVRPSASYFSKQFNRKRANNEIDLLKTIAERAGIFFFYNSTCIQCEIIAPNIVSLEQLFGFKIKAISGDGLPLSTGHFPQFSPDQGQASQLGVVGTPTFFLVSKKIGTQLIGQGVFDLNELKTRIVQVARHAEIISEAEYSPSDHVPGRQYMIPNSEQLKGINLDNPKDVLQYMRSAQL